MSDPARSKAWLTLCVALCLVSVSVLADVPRLMQYQGKLQFTSGASVPGPISLRVRLYDQASGAAPALFDETHAIVTLENGLFTVQIGSETPGGIPDAALAPTEVYLGSAIDGDPEMTPRRRIVTTPYTVKARSAEQLVRPDTLDSAVSVDANGGVGVGTTTPDASALIDMNSTTRGFLAPRMTTAQRDAIADPVTGLLIVNTDTNCLEFFQTVIWRPLGTPAAPGLISGPAEVCAGDSGVLYSVSDVPEATSYAWSVPAGASITAGQGTAFVTVTFGTGTGIVSVTASNACGTSASSNMGVSIESRPIPDTPGPIAGPGCAGGSGVVYSIDDVPNTVTYAWTVPSDATITAGQGTTSITVTFGIQSGTVAVNASNGCGTSAESVLPVGVYSGGSGSATFVATGSGRTGSIQQFIVPPGVSCITIEAWGAQGGDGISGPGSLGARMKGSVVVAPNDVLNVLVGQRGLRGSSLNGGGGGGTFVTDSLNNPLVIAGGGGGASDFGVGSGGTTANSGLPGNNGGGAGGSGGSGGDAGVAGSGGGLTGNGAAGSNSGAGGSSFINGGAGGLGGNAGQDDGGFGGGGGGGAGGYGGGGGGGYSGGGGGGVDFGGGGGGSFNSGGGQDNSPNVRAGDGRVEITW